MTESAAQPAAQSSVRALLRNRNFVHLWLGQSISDFGDSLTMLTLIFLINRLTGSTEAIATLYILITIPQITIGMLAGVYVDRLDRKRIMIVSDVLRGIFVLGFILVQSSGQLWLLFVIALIQASIGTFFTPARSAVIPNVVADDALLSANSFSQLSSIIARVAGTTAAGILAGVLVSDWSIFVVDAATFFVSVLFVSRVILPEHIAATAESSIWMITAQLREGVVLIIKSRILTGILAATAVMMLGLGAVNVLLVPLLVNDLGVSESWFGPIEFSQTASMIISAALVAALAARIRPTRMIATSMILLGVAIMFISQISRAWHIMIILFVAGWLISPLQAGISTLMQLAVDDRLRGRISAAYATVIQSTNVASMALAGVLGGVIGVRNVFVVGGIVTILAGVLATWIFGAQVPMMQPEADAGEALAATPAD